MPAREREPIFCSECQNEITKVETARVLDGHILCPADLHKRSFVDRIRARKLPEDFTRRGGVVFRSFFTSLAALMLVVGVAFIWRQDFLAAAGTSPASARTMAVTKSVASGESAQSLPPSLGPSPESRAEASRDLAVGVTMILASVFVLFFGVLSGDIVDLLLDIFDQLKILNRDGR